MDSEVRPYRARFGGRKYYKFAPDPWTGELLNSIVCPKCDELLTWELQ